MSSSNENSRRKLMALLQEKSVRTGSFTLASGKTSDFYVDVRQTALHADGARLIAELLLARLSKDSVGIGGMTLGADPIACATVALSVQYGRPVHGFIIRKEPKGHGTGRYLVGEGNLPPGSSVTMVEDTTTTGGSLLKAIQRAEDAGLKVVQCITIVDREEGAAEALQNAGYDLEALTTRTELLQTR